MVGDVVVEPDDTARRLRQYVRDNPDVRDDDYATNGVDPITEACYLLSEAYFHAKGGTDTFDVYRLDWGDVRDGLEGAHWFLRDSETDDVVDLSLPHSEDGDGVSWDVARHRAFITGYTPSNRTKRALDALNIEF